VKPGERRAVAWMTAGFGAGQIAGPVVAGYLADRSGDFFLACLAAAASLALAAIVIPPDSPRA
jgi:MFS family permease